MNGYPATASEVGTIIDALSAGNGQRAPLQQAQREKLRLLVSRCACTACGTPAQVAKQLEAELEHPQAAFWRHAWKVKGPGPAAESNPSPGWTLSGHSRSLERSGFVLNELNIFLDAGVGWRADTPNPEAILLTHGHIDHINALPMLLRCGDAKPFVFVPREHLNNVREMCRMTWAVKVSDATAMSRKDVEEIPDLFASGGDFQYFLKGDEEGEPVSIDNGGDSSSSSAPKASFLSTKPAPAVELAVAKDPEGSQIQKEWIAAQPGLHFRLPGSKNLEVCTVHCFHKTGDVGYVICQVVKSQRGVTPEADAEFAELKRLAQEDKKNAKTCGQRIQQMRKENLVVTVEESRPTLAYLLDTTVQVFGELCSQCQQSSDPESCLFRGPAKKSPFPNDYEACMGRLPESGHGGGVVTEALLLAQRELILRCGTIIVECTFLGASGMTDAEADYEAIKRTHTSWQQLKPTVLANPQCCFVLVHFSRRYKDSDIQAYFTKERADGPGFKNVVLWLDSGIIDFSS